MISRASADEALAKAMLAISEKFRIEAMRDDTGPFPGSRWQPD
jgi:hypothetical protein